MHKRSLLVAMAVAVPLASAGAVLGLPGGRDGPWERMGTWADETEHAFRLQSFAREPLWGRAAAGAAFAAYGRALALGAEPSQRDGGFLRRWRLGAAELAPGEQDAFAARWAPALAALSEGARCRDARPPLDWCGGPGVPLLPARDLVSAAAVLARGHLAAGRGRAAVELLLDAAALGVDLLQSPLMDDQVVACALLAATTGDALRDEDLARLDEDALAVLAAGLAAIDARCPLHFDGRGEVLRRARLLQREAAAGPLLGTADVADGTDGFAAVGGRARSVVDLAAAAARWAEPDDARWPPRLRALERIAAAREVKSDATLRPVLATWLAAERTLRATAAVVRLLRVAVACRQQEPGAAPPPLADPLGAGPFAVQRSRGVQRILSAGHRDDPRLVRTVARR